MQNVAEALEYAISKVVENLTNIEKLDAQGVRAALKLLPAAAAVVEKALADVHGKVCTAGQPGPEGDRLLSMNEVAARLGCSVATLRRGFRSGRYSFIIQDGGRMIGSERALERWIEARTKRQASR